MPQNLNPNTNQSNSHINPIDGTPFLQDGTPVSVKGGGTKTATPSKMEVPVNPIDGKPFNNNPSAADRYTGSVGSTTTYTYGEEDWQSFIDQDVKLFPDAPSFEQQRAENQSFGGQALGFLNQLVVGEIVGGTLEGFGYLGDVVSGVDALNGGEAELGNWLGNLGEGISEWTKSATPIYEEKAGGFNPSDPAWWFTNGVSVGSTLSLMIPGYSALKGASFVGKAGKIAAKAGKFGKTLAAFADTAKLGKLGSMTAKGISMATMSRHMEGMMEANQSFVQNRDKLLNTINDKTGELYTEEEANNIASTEASDVYRENWALLATDIPQYLLLMRGGLGKLVNAEMGLAGAAKAGKAALAGYVAQKSAGTLFQMGTESVEELYQHVLQRNAEYDTEVAAGLRPDTEKFSTRAKEYLQEDGAINAGIFGALGGGVFSAAGSVMSNAFKSQAQKEQEDNRIKERESRRERFMALNMQATAARESGDNVLYEQIQDTIKADIAIEAAANGNLDEAVTWMETFADMSEEEATKLNLSPDYKQRMKNAAKDMKEIGLDYAKSLNRYGGFAAPIIARYNFMNKQQKEAAKATEALAQTTKEKARQSLGTNVSALESQVFDAVYDATVNGNLNQIYKQLYQYEEDNKGNSVWGNLIGTKKQRDYERTSADNTGAIGEARFALEQLKKEHGADVVNEIVDRVNETLTGEVIGTRIKHALANTQAAHSLIAAKLFESADNRDAIEKEIRQKAKENADKVVEEAKDITDVEAAKDGTNDEVLDTALQSATENAQSTRDLSNSNEAVKGIDPKTVEGSKELADLKAKLIADSRTHGDYKAMLTNASTADMQFHALNMLVESTDPDAKGAKEVIDEYYKELSEKLSDKKILADPVSEDVASIPLSENKTEEFVESNVGVHTTNEAGTNKSPLQRILDGEMTVQELIAQNRLPQYTLTIDRQGVHGDFLEGLDFLAEGSESYVYQDTSDNTVVKISEAHNSDTFNARVQAAYAVDSILGTNSLQLVGAYELNGFYNPIFKQNFVEGRDATQNEIETFMRDKGFHNVENTRSYENTINGVKYTFTDLDGDNVRVLDDGNIVAIDAGVSIDHSKELESLEEEKVEETIPVQEQDQRDVEIGNPLYVLNFQFDLKKKDENGAPVNHGANDYGADWLYINDPTTLKAGTRLYVEIDNNDPWNKKILEGTTDLVAIDKINDKGKMILVHYINGDNKDNSLSNRKIVGMLKATQLSPELNAIRREVSKSFSKNNNITTSNFTLEVKSKYTGQIHNNEKQATKNPLDVLGKNQFVLGIVNEVDGNNFLVIPNNDTYQKVTWTGNIKEKGVYMIVPAANGDMIPVKLWVEPIGSDIAAQGVNVLKTANKSNYQEVLKKFKQVAPFGSVTFPNLDQNDFSVISYKMSGETIIKSLNDTTVVDDFQRMNYDVDIKKINTGSYNATLANKGILKTDLNVGTFTHSASFTIKPTMFKVSEEKQLPKAGEVYNIYDSSGEFEEQGTIVSVDSKNIRIKRESGIPIQVPIRLFSDKIYRLDSSPKTTVEVADVRTESKELNEVVTEQAKTPTREDLFNEHSKELLEKDSMFSLDIWNTLTEEEQDRIIYCL